MISLRRVLILFPLVTLSPLAIDIFLPALPGMAEVFAISTTQMQWTITAFIFSLGLGQLFLGPISDGIGRKPIALMGLVLYCVCALAMTTTSNFQWHLALRVIQGLASCAVVVAVFASVTDRFNENDSGKMYSYLNGVIFCIPALAPILGVQLTQHYGWQSNFSFMALMALVIGCLTWLYFKESNPVLLSDQKNNDAGKIKLPSFSDYKRIVKVSSFTFHVIANMLGMAIITAFVSTAPDVFINQYQLPEQQFTYWFAANAVLTIVFSFLTPKLLKVWSLNRVIFIAMVFIALSGLLLVLVTNMTNLLSYVLPVYLGTIGIALLMGTATGKALSPFKQEAGTATALLGFIQMSGSAILVTGLQASGIGPVEQLAWFSLAFVPMIMIRLGWLPKRTMTTVN